MAEHRERIETARVGGPAPDAAVLARILEVVPAGIVQISPAGLIVRANEQARRFLGLSWDVLLNRYVQDFDGETVYEDGTLCPVEEFPVSRCLSTGQEQGPLTLGVRRPDGQLRWGLFSALPCPFPGETRHGAIVTFLDITDRKRTESRDVTLAHLLEAVRGMHSRDATDAGAERFDEPLRTLLALTSSAAGYIACVTSLTDEISVLAALQQGQERSTSRPPAPLDALAAQAIATGEPVIVDEPMRVGDALGQRRVGRALVAPLRTRDRMVGVVALFDAEQPYSAAQVSFVAPLLDACADLVAAMDEHREHARLRAHLAQAERLASVGTLAAGMAHEINNPLAYVLLNLEGASRSARMLLGALDDEGRARHAELVERIAGHARDATEGADRVQRLVRDLMTFSRVGEEARIPVDVQRALDAALKMAHHEIRYRARLVYEEGELAPVLGNDGKLSQVFLNLLLNAARAIEEGHPDEHEVRVRTWMDGDEVKVEVRDTGEGIAPEHMDRLFDPFFSTRAPGAGAGLGLSICLSVVRAHGGRIEVTSERGHGSRFVVTLPRAPLSSAHPHSRERVASSPPPAALRVLVVDDEPMVLRVLGQLLGRHYDVVAADGVEEAIAALQNERFDVVLCDMMMLDGTGADLYAWAVERAPQLVGRIVFMTGGTFTPKAREFMAGVDAPHLVKPFQLAELQAVLQRITSS